MRAQSGHELPIPEIDFARLLRADEATATGYAKQLPDLQRARLALFLYARVHFRTLGLTVARECSRFGLTMEGGQAGAYLFEQSSSTSFSAERHFRASPFTSLPESA